MPRRRRKPLRQFLWWAVWFALLGVLLGIPISYQFQSGIVRALIGRWEYTHQVLVAAPSAIWNKVNSSGGSQVDPLGVIATLTTTVIITASATTLLGLRLTAKKRR